MRTVLAVAALLTICGCPPRNVNEDPAVARGRRAYLATCIACPHVDPTHDGAIGPALKGAASSLLASKVLKGEYPAGHTAKRASKLMPPQPALADSIDDLAAFLK
jgi:hypothetical protein